MKSILYTFFIFCDLCFWCRVEGSFAQPTVVVYSYVFLLRALIVFSLMFRFMVYFEFIFVHGVREESTSIICMRVLSGPSTIF